MIEFQIVRRFVGMFVKIGVDNLRLEVIVFQFEEVFILIFLLEEF